MLVQPRRCVDIEVKAFAQRARNRVVHRESPMTIPAVSSEAVAPGDEC
jgi:hypothetical protein